MLISLTPPPTGKLATSVAFAKKLLAESPNGEPVALEIWRKKGMEIALGGTEMGSPPVQVAQSAPVAVGEVVGYEVKEGSPLQTV